MNANQPHDPLSPTRRHKLAAIARQFWPLCRHVGAGMNPAWSPVGKVWHCVWPMLPAVTLALTLVLVAVVFPSCDNGTTRGPDTSAGGKSAPRTTEGVPIIRVLVTSSPQDSVLIDTRGGYRLLADGRVISESTSAMPRAQISRTGRTWNITNLHPSADTITVEAVGGQVRLGETLYCGSVSLRPAGTGGIIAINHVDLETYIAGVLPKELYAYWAPETYRTLAVAARTFARYQMLNNAGREYDVGDNQGSQMYGGFTAATPKSWSAVRDTHGVMLAYGPKGREKIFYVQYSACNGGVVNGAAVLREVDESEKIPPLAGGQADPDGQKCPHHRWGPLRISKADIFKAMRASSYASAARLTNVREVKVASETPYGRPVWLDVVDTAGNSVRLRADDLRLLLLRGGPKAAKELYSMNCRIRDVGDAIEFAEGKGFGHGVGLSQWGAEDKALQGWSPERILQFYYPGAVLIRAY